MPKYLSPAQVVELVPGMTKSVLAQLRFSGRGPQYRAPTPKKIIYEESEVIAWVERSARSRTGDAA